MRLTVCEELLMGTVCHGRRGAVQELAAVLSKARIPVDAEPIGHRLVDVYDPLLKIENRHEVRHGIDGLLPGVCRRQQTVAVAIRPFPLPSMIPGPGALDKSLRECNAIPIKQQPLTQEMAPWQRRGLEKPTF